MKKLTFLLLSLLCVGLFANARCIYYCGVSSLDDWHDYYKSSYALHETEEGSNVFEGVLQNYNKSTGIYFRFFEVLNEAAGTGEEKHLRYICPTEVGNDGWSQNMTSAGTDHIRTSTCRFVTDESELMNAGGWYCPLPNKTEAFIIRVDLNQNRLMTVNPKAEVFVFDDQPEPTLTTIADFTPACTNPFPFPPGDHTFRIYNVFEKSYYGPESDYTYPNPQWMNDKYFPLVKDSEHLWRVDNFPGGTISALTWEERNQRAFNVTFASSSAKPYDPSCLLVIPVDGKLKPTAENVHYLYSYYDVLYPQPDGTYKGDLTKSGKFYIVGYVGETFEESTIYGPKTWRNAELVEGKYICTYQETTVDKAGSWSIYVPQSSKYQLTMNPADSRMTITDTGYIPGSSVANQPGLYIGDVQNDQLRYKEKFYVFEDGLNISYRMLPEMRFYAKDIPYDLGEPERDSSYALSFPDDYYLVFDKYGIAKRRFEVIDELTTEKKAQHLKFNDTPHRGYYDVAIDMGNQVAYVAKEITWFVESTASEKPSFRNYETLDYPHAIGSYYDWLLVDIPAGTHHYNLYSFNPSNINDLFGRTTPIASLQFDEDGYALAYGGPNEPKYEVDAYKFANWKGGYVCLTPTEAYDLTDIDRIYVDASGEYAKISDMPFLKKHETRPLCFEGLIDVTAPEGQKYACIPAFYIGRNVDSRALRFGGGYERGVWPTSERAAADEATASVSVIDESEDDGYIADDFIDEISKRGSTVKTIEAGGGKEYTFPGLLSGQVLVTVDLPRQEVWFTIWSGEFDGLSEVKNDSLRLSGGKGSLTAESAVDATLQVYNLQGSLVAVERLTPGEPRTITLPAGLYVATGRKLLVR